MDGFLIVKYFAWSFSKVFGCEILYNCKVLAGKGCSSIRFFAGFCADEAGTNCRGAGPLVDYLGDPMWAEYSHREGQAANVVYQA